ncbi:glucoamylase family protein [Rhodobacter capsulatus]|uniref:glucoamylase family protein n=1 Tax=Rhodobacter capsulatus TaxID=1061 RepID=UPI004024E90B
MATAPFPRERQGRDRPTAALAAAPYLPRASLSAARAMAARPELWGPFGLVDAFDDTRGWVAASHLAIDQGPIVGMIENARTGLLWRLFMSAPEVKTGLRRLGFASPHLGPDRG